MERVVFRSRLQAEGAGKRYRARLISAGRTRSAGNRPGMYVIEPGALEEGAALFDNVPMFVDHAMFRSGPSLTRLAGQVRRARYDAGSGAILADIELLNTQAGRLMAEIAGQLTAADPPDIGLSAVLWIGEATASQTYGGVSAGDGGDPVGLTRVRRIAHVESVDFVFEPAANGRLLAALSAVPEDPGAEVRLLAEAGVLKPRAEGRLPREVGVLNPQGENAMPEKTHSLPTLPGRAAAYLSPATAGAESAAPLPAPALPYSAPTVSDLPEEWLDALTEETVRRLREMYPPNSGAPAAVNGRRPNDSREREREPLDALEQLVQAVRAELADLQEERVIQLGGPPPRERSRVAGYQVGLDGFGRLQMAAEALIAGERPPAGIAPLSGVRELYLELSGDYEMTGRFFPERVTFANVDTGTMAGLVANALNKRVVQLFRQYPHWWAPAVTEEDFSTLQDARWVTLGGVGELPNVAEGAAYTELTWDDQTETDAFVKKGGYLGITLEAIDKDDTRRLRAAPRALAQSAWLTLGKAIAAIFTTASGAGPTMSDGVALFHANHNNVGTTAFSYPAWKTVRNAMRKQTELSSGERLGFLTEPQLLWVPSDLYDTALETFASRHDPSEGTTTSFEKQNIAAEGDSPSQRLAAARRRIIMCPIWTDTNNWAAQADPLLYPSIGLGYRYGRTPEVFSVASPTGGLMFTNDTMPVKVRFFFAVGPTDWRGLYKMNVA